MMLRVLLSLASMLVVIGAVLVIAGCSFTLPKNTGQPSKVLSPAVSGPLADAVSRMLLDDHGVSGLDSEIAALQGHPPYRRAAVEPF